MYKKPWCTCKVVVLLIKPTVFFFFFFFFSLPSASLDLKVPILAAKRDSRCHPTTSFRENVELAATRYQMLEVLSFCDQERVEPPSLKVTMLTLLVKNGKMKLSGETTF